MATEYKVLISWADLATETQSKVGITNPIESEKVTQTANKSPETKATANKSNDMLKKLQTATAVYAFGRQAGQMIVNSKATDYQIRGETLKAERLQMKYSNITNNVGLGLGVGASVLTGNPIVIALTAYSLAQRAMNLANDTKKYMAEISNERYRSQYYQNRLVKDISEVR